MKPAWILVVIALFGAGLSVSGAPAGDVRFSRTLSAEEKTSVGMEKLSSDHVAVIDALVRRDTTARVAAADKDDAAARFSQRLTADERKTAGLTLLAEEQVPRLDALVDRFQGAKLARSLLSPPAYLSRHARMNPEAKPEKKLHGEFSLSYGFGSGGYSEKAGSMVIHFDDPDRNLRVSIGYAESHIKGGQGYYDPLYRDPFYRDPFHRDPFHRDPFYRGRDPFYDSRDPLYPSRDPRFESRDPITGARVIR